MTPEGHAKEEKGRALQLGDTLCARAPSQEAAGEVRPRPGVDPGGAEREWGAAERKEGPSRQNALVTMAWGPSLPRQCAFSPVGTPACW